MSAFGYGSSYSFRDGSFMPGPSQGYGGMGQDPRQIVSKSGIDSMKGAYSDPARMPVYTPGDRFSNPYGNTFNNNNVSADTAPLFGSNVSYDSLRSNMGNIQNHSARLAAGALGRANPNAFGQGAGSPISFDPSGIAAGEMSNYYQQAYNMLNSSRQNISGSGGYDVLPFNPNEFNFYQTPDFRMGGTASSAQEAEYRQRYSDWRNQYQQYMSGTLPAVRQLSTNIDQAMSGLETEYQAWLNKMMQSGAYGLTGSTVSY